MTVRFACWLKSRLGNSVLAITSPEGIRADHFLDAFESRHQSLNVWLKEKALHNLAESVSRTYVVCDDESEGGRRVVGYFALATGSVAHKLLSARMRRNCPDPIPAVVLGRLAVDANYEGRGIGSGLLKDAIARSLRTAQEIGVRVILCHSIDDDAKAFYLRYGFIPSPIEPLTVMLPVADLVRRLENPA